MDDRNLLLGRPRLEVVDTPSAGPHRVSRWSLLLGIATAVFSLVPQVVSRESRCVVPCWRAWQCRLQPSLRASALSTLCTSLLPPLVRGGSRYGFTGDRRSSGNCAGRGPLSISRFINVAVRHTSLRAAWLMMTVPLPTGEKGAAQSLIRTEAQVVIRAHPRTPPRRSTAKKSISSFHTW